MPRSWNLSVWKSNNDTSEEMLREQARVTIIVARNSFVAPARMKRFNTSSIQNVTGLADVRESVLTFAILFCLCDRLIHCTGECRIFIA
jgi:hypothetical protein